MTQKQSWSRAQNVSNKVSQDYFFEDYSFEDYLGIGISFKTILELIEIEFPENPYNILLVMGIVGFNWEVLK